MILSIVILLVGLLILCGGLYYLTKNPGDPEARKIYGITAAVGAVIAIAAAVKGFVLG